MHTALDDLFDCSCPEHLTDDSNLAAIELSLSHEQCQALKSMSGYPYESTKVREPSHC